MRSLLIIILCIYSSNIFAQLHEFKNGNSANATQINDNFNYLEEKTDDIKNTVDSISDHTSSSVAHGASSDIVGISDTQTLTNKRLDNPKFNENVDLTVTSTQLNQLNSGQSFVGFSVYITADQSIMSTRKVRWDAVEFDTNGDFNLSLDRFTPSIEGKYLLTVLIACNPENAPRAIDIRLYRNGAYFKNLSYSHLSASYAVGAGGSVIVHANGTTDYFEVYAGSNFHNPQAIHRHTTGSYFQGYLIR